MTTACSEFGDHDAHLLLLLGREDVDDAVDRRRRALRVQRAEDEVAGLRGGERGRDRLEVAHLADEDHVRVLAERGLQRFGEARRVGADLALVDDALLVAVHELDRILDREDVLGARAVDLVDDRGERRRLTGAGRAGDEDEPARILGEAVQDRAGGSSSSSVLISCGIETEGRADRLALVVDVDAEAGEARHRVGEVELAVQLEVLLLLAREDPVEERARVVGVNGSKPSARTMCPRTRNAGGLPTVTCRSEAPSATICSSRSSMEVSCWHSPSTELSAARCSSLECRRALTHRG